jgi:hypothetical protein
MATDMKIDLDYELSPYTGLTRESWLGAYGFPDNGTTPTLTRTSFFR